MGLTPADIVEGFTLPQIAALAESAGRPKASDPAALQPGERKISSAELAELIEERKKRKKLNASPNP